MKNVVVSAHVTAIDAHIVRGLLEAQGIPAYVQDDQYITMNWMMSHALGGVKVTVPASFKAQALEVLKNAEADQYHLNQLDESTLTSKQAETYIPEEPIVCPKCHSNHVTPLDLSRKFSLVIMLLIHAPLAFSKHYYSCDDCDHVFTPDYSRCSHFSRITLTLVSVLLAMLMVFAYVANGFRWSHDFSLDDTYFIIDEEPADWADDMPPPPGPFMPDT